jgi:predicted PurR-regulated permease PerM
LQQLYSSFTAALQQLYSSFTAALQQLYSSFTTALQQLYNSFTTALQQLYSSFTTAFAVPLGQRLPPLQRRAAQDLGNTRGALALTLFFKKDVVHR